MYVRKWDTISNTDVDAIGPVESSDSSLVDKLFINASKVATHCDFLLLGGIECCVPAMEIF